MLGLGTMEILLLLAIVVVIFGASRLPEIGKGLGTGIQEFRRSMKNKSVSDDQVEVEEDKKEIPE